MRACVSEWVSEWVSEMGKTASLPPLQKSNLEFEKYVEEQKLLEKEQSLNEIEADIKKLQIGKKS